MKKKNNILTGYFKLFFFIILVNHILSDSRKLTLVVCKRLIGTVEILIRFSSCILTPTIYIEKNLFELNYY